MVIELENYCPALKQGATVDIDTSKLDFTGNSSGNIILAGSSATPLSTSTANSKWLQVYVSNTATSGDNRAAYLRHYTSGAGGGGDGARIFHTVNGVVAGTCQGAHTSLNFVSTANSGRCTGQGIASRNTLHIPNDASWAPGNVTYSALQAEIYCDGASSDPQGATNLSFIRLVNGGNATGGADVDDDAFAIQFSGFTVASGNVVQTETDETKFSHKIKCDVGGTTLYLMACAT